MTAPDVGLKKQKRRHWGPLVGLAAIGVFVLVVFLLLGGSDVDQQETAPATEGMNAPQQTAPATDGMTAPQGAPQQTGPSD